MSNYYWFCLASFVGKTRSYLVTLACTLHIPLFGTLANPWLPGTDSSPTLYSGSGPPAPGLLRILAVRDQAFSWSGRPPEAGPDATELTRELLLQGVS